MQNLGTVTSLVPARTLSFQDRPERLCSNLMFAGVLVSTLLVQTSFSQAAEPVGPPAAEVREPATRSISAGPQVTPSGSILETGASQANILALLDQYLSTSSGRKLAAEVAAILKKGEPSRAEPLLLDAINTGTLASLLVDQLENPSLPMQLEASDQPSVTTAVDPIPAETTEDQGRKGPDPALIAESERLKESLQRELERNQSITQELAAARDDIGARESKIAELQENLRQEQSRTEATLASLSAEQQEASKRQGQDEQIAELQVALQQERERAEQANASATALQEQFATNDKAGLRRESRIAELEESLKEERARADGLVRDYTAAQEAVSSLEILKAQNAELRKELDAEREQNNLVASQLTAARRQNVDLETNANAAAKLQRLLQQERDRSTAASHSLANARNEIGMLKGRLAQMVDEVWKQDHEILDNLARSGSVQMGFEFFSSRNRAAPIPTKADLAIEAFAAMAPGPDKQDATSSGEPRGTQFPMALLPSLSQTGATPPASAGARGLDSAASESFASAGVTGSLSVSLDPAGGSASTPAEAAPVGSNTVRLVVPTPVSKETSLVRRADALLRSGDVSGARLVLERASNEGSAQAAFRLGETYDPAVLSELGALGIRGNTAMARELYLKAVNGGVEQAAQRLQALK